MIKLPDFKKSFEYENNFYLSSDQSRIHKIIIHYQLYEKIKHLNGSIIECGVFKGISSIRFAAFRDFFNNSSNKLILFDIFGKFPEADYSKDVKNRNNFIKDAGLHGISKNQLNKILKNKKIKNFELIQGDITKTVKTYAEKHPRLKISLLHIDVDLYGPTKTILENFYPHVVKGGIIILDDYNVFPGETKAVNEFFKNQKINIQKFKNRKTPYYIIKK